MAFAVKNLELQKNKGDVTPANLSAYMKQKLNQPDLNTSVDGAAILKYNQRVDLENIDRISLIED